MKTRIRKATPDDIDQVLDLESEFTVIRGKKPQYEAEFSNALSHFYVAVDSASHEIVGYSIFWIIDNLIEIHHFGIKTSHQRLGIGSAIMRAICRKARRDAVDQIYLEVRKSNHQAIAFYEKMGFSECGFRKGYYQNPPDDALLFRKSV